MEVDVSMTLKLLHINCVDSCCIPLHILQIFHLLIICDGAGKMSDESKNPCIQCGACCAYFRASFYWAECDNVTEGGVPVTLTMPFGPFRCMMQGTSGSKPRCVALIGEISKAVRCSIYQNRSSVCREFTPSYQNGSANTSCDKARSKWNMAPLTPADWQEEPPFDFPRAA